MNAEKHHYGKERSAVSFSQKASLMIGGAAVAILVAEVALRVLLFINTPPGMVFDDQLVYRYQPNTDTGEVVTNGHGCIGDDFDLESDLPRVLLLGGSTSFSKVYVDSVRSSLANPAQVMSCGRPRYTSHQANVQAARLADELKPDVIVVYLGINDNIYNSFRWVQSLPRVGFFDYGALNQSVLYELIRYHLLDKAVFATPDFKELPLRSTEIFERNLRSILATSRSRGIRVVLSTFAHSSPQVEQERGRDAEAQEWQQRLVAGEPLMRHFWGDVESTLRGIEAHNQVSRLLAREFGLPLAGVAEQLTGRFPLYVDLCHFTEEGNRLFGGIVGETVSEVLWPEQPAS